MNKRISRTSTLCIKAAITVAFFSASVQVAHAAEGAPVLDPVFGNTPLTCLTEASALVNQQMFRATPENLLGGLRKAVGKGADWKRGDPNYDSVRGIVVDALMAEEKARGPIFKLSPEQVLNAVASRWSADERRYFANFFARESGKLYQAEIAEGPQCKGWLAGLNGPPYHPLEGAEKARWEYLMGSFAGGEQRFKTKLRRLSKEEKASFEAGYAKLADTYRSALEEVTRQSVAALPARYDAALSAHNKQILELARRSR